MAALWGGQALGDSEGGVPVLPVPAADPGTAWGARDSATDRLQGRSQASSFPTYDPQPVPPAELPAQGSQLSLTWRSYSQDSARRSGWPGCGRVAVVRTKSVVGCVCAGHQFLGMSICITIPGG